MKLSHGEREVFTILTNENLYFEINKKFPDLGLLSYDFYIPDQNTVIEYDGIYHYKQIKKNQIDFKRVQTNDRLKDDYAKVNGLKLIRIPYYEHNSMVDILYKNGVIKSSGHTLNRKTHKNSYAEILQNGIPKNFKYRNPSALYSADEITNIRNLYYSGSTRPEIEKILNIKLNRYSYNDIVGHKSYFDPNYITRHFEIKTRRKLTNEQEKIKRIENKKRAQEYLVMINSIQQANINHEKRRKEIYAQVALLSKEIKVVQKKISDVPFTKIEKIVEYKVLVKDRESFIKLGAYKNYDRYDYSKFVFAGKDVKGIIICTKHGEFLQTPHNHLSPNKATQCPQCAVESRVNKTPAIWRDPRTIKGTTKKTIVTYKRDTHQLNQSLHELKTKRRALINQLKQNNIDHQTFIDKNYKR